MRLKLFIATAVFIPFASAHAANLATGQQISDAVTGNTVQGSMAASGVYTEYYAADGVVHGHGRGAIQCGAVLIDVLPPQAVQLQEREHLGEAEPAEVAEHPRPRIEEHGLDIEDDEEDRRQIEFHARPDVAAAA